MSATYNSHTFHERGSVGLSNPGWGKKFITAVKIIPGGSPVVQSIASDVQRLAMPIQGTASELAALEGDADGDTHSLAWSGGTDTCLLEEMAPRVEVMPGVDLYQSVLTFIK
jgi:hypothetical protein